MYLSPKSYHEEALALCSLWRIEKEVCTLLEEVQGSGIRVQGSGFRVEGSGFRFQGSGFRVQGSGFRVQGSPRRPSRRRRWRSALCGASKRRSAPSLKVMERENLAAPGAFAGPAAVRCVVAAPAITGQTFEPRS